MECNKCGKEINSNDGVVYCPYCGVKLKNKDTRKSIWTREVGYGVQAFIVWLLLCVIFFVFFTVFKDLLSRQFGLEIPGLLSWIVIFGIVVIALYFTLAYVIYHHAIKHNRRAGGGIHNRHVVTGSDLSANVDMDLPFCQEHAAGATLVLPPGYFCHLVFL
ncbi:hypothetical protein ACFLYF_04960 [Chloroflexota bacterium]